MRSVGAFEAKTHLSQLIDEVNRTGEGIVVQRRGRNMAVIEPYANRTSEHLQTRREHVLKAFRDIRASQRREASAESLESLIEEGRR